MIPAPGERDGADAHDRYAVIASGQSKGIGDDDYYGYDDGLYDRVAASFAAHGVPVDGQRVSLHRGLFDDTLHPTAPVALAHIDSDWYDPVKTCLERIYPQLSPGGLVVLDDYNDFRGCREAVDEFLAATPDMSLHDTSSNATLIRG
jgi:asparagine synthase (glutamine-hydrolysing)